MQNLAHLLGQMLRNDMLGQTEQVLGMSVASQILMNDMVEAEEKNHQPQPDTVREEMVIQKALQHGVDIDDKINFLQFLKYVNLPGVDESILHPLIDAKVEELRDKKIRKDLESQKKPTMFVM